MFQRQDASSALTLDQFSQIVERHYAAIYAFLCGFTKDNEQAKDLLQDTCYLAWQAAERQSPPFIAGGEESEMRRWLYRVAYHRAISYLRRRQIIRWESLDFVDLPHDALLMITSFEDQIAENEALHQAMEYLVPEDVACLLLIIVQGFTAAEAASIMGATTHAVSKRIARAKRRLLSAYLKQDGRQGGKNA